MTLIHQNRDMASKTPLQIVQEKIIRKCAPYLKKLEKEKDEIKRLKLQFQISKKTLYVALAELKKLSDSQWEKYMEELFEPLVKQSEQISEKIDTLILKKSPDAKEYERYQKLKRISEKGNADLFQVLDQVDLNKKQLERLLIIFFKHMIAADISLIQNNLDFYEFNEAGGVVQRRFGFDYNWLVCLSLIQLHENLVKKKITELGGEIRKEDRIDSLVPVLLKLIKEKEGRDVSLALLMSDGLKKTRNLMTHHGYKQSVSKSDLEKIFNEITSLEQTLYPNTIDDSIGNIKN